MTKEQYKAGLIKMIEGTREERVFLAEHSFGLFCLYYFQDYFKYPPADFHYDFIQDIEDLDNGVIREVLWIGFRECAKLQPGSSKLLTPNGWKQMKELREGDFVISRDGVPTKILHKTRPQRPDMYRFTFKDGTVTDFGDEHNHILHKYGRAEEYVKTTLQIKDNFIKYNTNRKNKRDPKQWYQWSVPLPKPIEFNTKIYNIHPYVMGYALANGYFGNGVISTHIDDIEEIKSYFIEYGENISTTDTYGNASRFYPLKLRTKLSVYKELRSKTKYIPSEYLYGDVEQRLSLLHGLLDGDGTMTKVGGVLYNTYSKQLAEDVRSLVLSLGGIAEVQIASSDRGYNVRINMNLCPFLLKRKAIKWKPSKRRGRTIINIEKVPTTEDGYCIAVDSPTKSYITEDYLVTHNTTFAQFANMWFLAYKKRVYINVDSYSGTNSERSLFDIAYHLLNNQRLIADFGNIYTRKRGLNDMKQNKVDNFTTENGCRIEASTTQIDVRGRKHLKYRPDFRWVDDFETHDTKDSEAVTTDIRNNITSAMGGMEGNACQLYTANFLTEYGNVQWLIDRAKEDPKIRVRNIPVIQDGKPTWPSKYALTDQEAVAENKISLEDRERQLGHLVFSYEMMNQPIDETVAEFKREWVKYTLPSMLDHMQTNCYITIDSAVSEKESADYTGITINKISRENIWYVKTYRMKMNSKDLIDHIFYLHDTYKPIEIGIEKTTFTLAIKPFFEDEMRKRNKFIRIIELEHKQTNKETRIRGLIPRLQSGSIIFLEKSLTLLDEMRTFPNGQHDDELDSLAYQLQVARAPFDSSAVPKPKPFNRFGV